MERVFKIHCSQISKIMGNAKVKGELSQTCKTFLHEWYANDREEIHSKYIEKGLYVENELIDMAAEKLGFGMAEKNTEHLEDEYFIGECDVNLPHFVIDVKACWDNGTLLKRALDGFDLEYEMQGQGYMHLYKKFTFILFYGLLDTPEEVNYNQEVSFQHIPEDERWIAYSFSYDIDFINKVIERVKQCRDYLIRYDALVKSRLGKVNSEVVEGAVLVVNDNLQIK